MHCKKALALVVLFGVKLTAFEILAQSKETDALGFGEWNIATDGESVVMAEFLRPNDLVFDIGGNHGEWSTFALRYQPTLRVMAFEPVKPVFESLKSAIGHHGNVKLFNFALSDAEGKTSFHYYANADGLSGFFFREVLRGDQQDPVVIEVEQTTIDSFCAENAIDEIGFVKIDTEGAEWKILQGARRLIEERKIRAIQFEYGGCYVDAKTTLKGVMQFLSANGYLIFRIVPSGLVHIARWEESLENYNLSNYFAIRQQEVPGYALVNI